MPFFYQYVLGGAVATSAAILLAAADLEVNSALVGFALAAGVIFGQLVVQPVRRPGNRIERRMGPRLIGPPGRQETPAPGRDLSEQG